MIQRWLVAYQQHTYGKNKQIIWKFSSVIVRKPAKSIFALACDNVFLSITFSRQFYYLPQLPVYVPALWLLYQIHDSHNFRSISEVTSHFCIYIDRDRVIHKLTSGAADNIPTVSRSALAATNRQQSVEVRGRPLPPWPDPIFLLQQPAISMWAN